ncbi:MAG: O-antigen ligase family protein [Actinobacteria bacterium]|nr:O-antigen ligase family protein [Actinomycetota bacterium]MBI3686602.1 O-antigen ligase family protein [Actinomycetota bacterium]
MAWPDVSGPDRPAGRVGRRADAATLLCWYAGILLIIPNHLVIAGLSFNLTPSLLLGLGLGMWWFCAQLVSNLGAAKGRNAVRTGLFLFLAANIASYGYATYNYLPGDELKAADRSTLTMVGYIMVGILVVDGVRSLVRLDALLLVVVNTTAVVAIVGLLQFFINIDISKPFELIPGLHPVAPLSFVLERSIFRRPAGTTGHPIEFGVLTAMVLPLAVHYAFYRPLRQATGQLSAAWWRWATVTLIGMGALISLSRSAILGLVAGGIILLPTWPPRRRVRALATIAGFTVFMRLLVPGLIGTLLSLFKNLGGDPSIQGRTNDYAAAGKQIHDHLLFGRGFGTYLPSRYGPLDNQYLGSMVETGVVGVASLVIMMFTAVAAVRASRRVSEDVVTRDLAQSLAASVVILIAAYATYDAFGFSMATGLSFVLIGACGVLLRLSQLSRNAAGREAVP